MAKTPEQAVAAAREAKERRSQQADEKAKRQAEFPRLADERMTLFANSIQAAMPGGYNATIDKGSGGLLGERGVVGIFIKFREGDRILSQGNISVSRDETIVTLILPPDGDKRNQVRSSDISFYEFDETDAVALLTSMIDTYGV